MPRHVSRPVPPALPATVEGLMAIRPRERALNPAVADLCWELWENDDFRRCLEAIDNEHSLTGHVLLDRSKAAKMAFDLAEDHPNHPALSVNEYKLIKSIRVWMRSRGIGEKQRLQAITSQPNGNGHDSA